MYVHSLRKNYQGSLLTLVKHDVILMDREKSYPLNDW